MKPSKWHRRGSWLDQWKVNEDEPSWAAVIAVGAAFVICLIGLSMAIWLLAPEGAGWPS